MITYGSYISHLENLPKAALWVTSLDTLIAVMAGFLILPAVFTFGFDPAAGPGLTFITLPAATLSLPRFLLPPSVRQAVVGALSYRWLP